MKNYFRRGGRERQGEVRESGSAVYGSRWREEKERGKPLSLGIQILSLITLVTTTGGAADCKRFANPADPLIAE